MLLDQLPEAEPFVQLPNQDQPAVGSDTRSLEITFNKPLKLSWNGLFSF